MIGVWRGEESVKTIREWKYHWCRRERNPFIAVGRPRSLPRNCPFYDLGHPHAYSILSLLLGKSSGPSPCSSPTPALTSLSPTFSFLSLMPCKPPVSSVAQGENSCAISALFLSSRIRLFTQSEALSFWILGSLVWSRLLAVFGLRSLLDFDDFRLC